MKNPTEISHLFEALTELEAGGDVRNVDVKQTRRVHYDRNGAPIEDADEPTTVVVKFTYGGKTASKSGRS